jgi:Ca2+-dependent lipid-binding protein
LNLTKLSPVVAGKNLAPKNGGLYSNPYCIVMILNEQGGRVCKDKKTKAIKKNLNPQWNARFEL